MNMDTSATETSLFPDNGTGMNSTTGGDGSTPGDKQRLLVTSLSAVLVLWIFFLLLFARLFGYIATKIINKMRPGLNVHIGAMSISLLTSKLSMHNVKMTAADGSVAVDSLTVIFRWWRYYKPRRRFILPGKDCPDCPLTVHMEGLRGHWYNRSEVYSSLEKIFTGDHQSETEVDLDGTQAGSGESPLDTWWAEWIPAVHFHIVTGQIDLGNNHLPTSLSYRAETVIGLLTMERPECDLDKASYIAQCRCQGVTIMLLPSPGYQGEMEEAPRFGKEGFVVTKSGVVTLKYLQDDAGVWPIGSVVAEPAYSDPQWNLDIEFGADAACSQSRITETSTVTWGPWADRQRAYLQRFFFPQTYQAMEVTAQPHVGKTRAHTTLNLNVYLRTPAVVEFVFAKDSLETSSIYVEAGATSFLNMTYPWLVQPTGLTVTTDVTLVDVNVSTSLLYRPWIDTDRLELKMSQVYPLAWNGLQQWTTMVTMSDTAFVYLDSHLVLVSAMIEDLGSKEPPDLLNFIPYTWTVGVKLENFRMLWMCNPYNWLDCSPSKVAAADNASISLHGEEFLVDLEYPNLEFQAPVYNSEYRLRARNVMADLHLPQWHGARGSFVSLARATHTQWLAMVPEAARAFHYRSDETDATRFPTPKLNMARLPSGIVLAGPATEQRSAAAGGSSSPAPQDEWFSCLWAPGASIVFRYKSHSAVPFPDAVYPAVPLGALPTDPVWPTEPNRLEMELNVSPGQLRLSGSLLRHFLMLRENYFGGYQKYHRIPSASFARVATTTRLRQLHPDGGGDAAPLVDDDELEPQRQLDIEVSIVVDRLHAILPKHVASSTEVLPTITMEGLALSMVKDIKEGHLNVAIGPCHVNLRGSLQRPAPDDQMNVGSLRLNGITICAEGLYDGIDQTFVEYGWLVHLALSPLIGQVSIPQLHQVFGFLQPFLLQLVAEEDQLKLPPPLELSIPKLNSSLKTILPQNLTDRAEVLKYTMIRLIAPEFNVQVVESGCQLLLRGGPFRLANCTLANQECTEGYSLQLRDFQLIQYVQESRLIGGAGPEENQAAQWLDAGNIHVPEITVDLRMKEPFPIVKQQTEFLLKHDRTSRRLWFLWRNQDFCGCCGNCHFSSAQSAESGDGDDQEEWNSFTAAWLNPYADACAKRGEAYAGDSLSDMSSDSDSSEDLALVIAAEAMRTESLILSTSSSSSSSSSTAAGGSRDARNETTPTPAVSTAEHDGGLLLPSLSADHPILQRFTSAPLGFAATKRTPPSASGRLPSKAAGVGGSLKLLSGQPTAQQQQQQYSCSHLSVHSRASMATVGSDAYFSCEDLTTSNANVSKAQARRQLMRRMSRHSMGKSRERSSSESSFMSALGSLAPSEALTSATAAEDAAVSAAAAAVAARDPEDPAARRSAEPTARRSRLSLHNNVPVTSHYAECLDAFYGDGGGDTHGSASPPDDDDGGGDGGDGLDARLLRESFHRRPRKSFSSTPLHQTKLVQRTPVLTRSACGSPTRGVGVGSSSYRSAGAHNVSRKLGRVHSMTSPVPEASPPSACVSDGPAEAPCGGVRGETIPEEGEAAEGQRRGTTRAPVDSAATACREVRAAVAVPSGIDLLITPLVVAAMQRYSQVIPSFASTTTLASTVDWLHDATLSEHGRHSAHTVATASSSEPNVPRRTVLSVDLPTVSCRILQASTAVHGGTRSSKVSVICLVVEEARLLAQSTTPDLAGGVDAPGRPEHQTSFSNLPSGAAAQQQQGRQPPDVLASVDVKSVHAQLCSQDKQASGLSPDVSRVCFSLDSPFGQFGDSGGGGEVLSSILCEFGVERLHLAVLRQSQARLQSAAAAAAAAASQRSVEAVATPIASYSSSQRQSVFANPAALYSYNPEQHQQQQQQQQDEEEQALSEEERHEPRSPEGMPTSPPSFGQSPVRHRAVSAASAAASAQPLDTCITEDTEVYGSVSELWVQLPSAPKPADVVASGELPINVLSAANLVLDIWTEPVTSIVGRATTLIAEADKIRSHAICVLLEELMISSAVVNELTVLHIRKPFSRLCCQASDLKVLRALYLIPRKALGRPVTCLCREDGDGDGDALELELGEVKSGILAQSVGWLAARESHNAASRGSAAATPLLLVAHHRSKAGGAAARARPPRAAATATDYLMAIPNIAHHRLVELAAGVRCLAAALDVPLPAQVQKHLARSGAPYVPRTSMAKFEVTEITVHVCPWHTPRQQQQQQRRPGGGGGLLGGAERVHKVVSCQTSSLQFWSEQELVRSERPAPVSALEAVLFATGDGLSDDSSATPRMKRQLTLRRNVRALASLGELAVVPSQDLLEMAAFLAASRDQYCSQSVSVDAPCWARAAAVADDGGGDGGAAPPSRRNTSSWQSVQYFITVFSRRMARQQMEWQALRPPQLGTRSRDSDAQLADDGRDEVDSRRRRRRQHRTRRSVTTHSLNSLLEMSSDDDDDDDIDTLSDDDDDGNEELSDGELEDCLEVLLTPGIADEPDALQRQEQRDDQQQERRADALGGEAADRSADEQRSTGDSCGSDPTPVGPSPEPTAAESAFFTFIVNKIGLTWSVGRARASACVEPCQFVASSDKWSSPMMPASTAAAAAAHPGKGLSCSATIPSLSLEIAAYSGNGFTSLLTANVEGTCYLLSKQDKQLTHRIICSSVTVHVPRPFVTVARLLNRSSDEIVTAVTAVQHWKRVGDHFARMGVQTDASQSQGQSQSQGHGQSQRHGQSHGQSHSQSHGRPEPAVHSVPVTAGSSVSTDPVADAPDQLLAGEHVLSAILRKLVVDIKFVHRASIAYEVQNVECNGILSGLERCIFAQIRSHTLACHADVPQQAPSLISLVLPATVVTLVRKLTAASEAVGARLSGPRASARRLAQLRQTLTVTMDRFTHRLTTDAVYQLAVMQKSFAKEFDEARKIWEENSAELSAASVLGNGKLAQPVHQEQQAPKFKDDPLLTTRHRVLNVLRFKWQGIQLTASTPASASVVIRTGSVSGDLAQQGYGSGSLDRHYRGKINLTVTAKLGNAVMTGFFREDEDGEDDFESMAYFTTSVSLQNMIKGEHERSGEKTSSLSTVLANLGSPRIWCSTKAIDPALRLWLNYQAALKVWQQQQQQPNYPLRVQRPPDHMEPEEPQEDMQTTSYLLQLQLRDLGICVPFVLPHQTSQTSPIKAPNSPGLISPGPSLLLHIAEIAVSTSLAHSTASQGTFRSFCLQLLEYFDEKQASWEPKLFPLINGAHVPEGSCIVCSRSILADHQDGEEGYGEAAPSQTTSSVVNDKVSLCVNFHMAGIDAHADTDVSPLLVGMVDAFTAATADLDMIEGSSTPTVKTPQPPSPPPPPPSLTLEPPSPGPEMYLTPAAPVPAFVSPPLRLDVTKACLADLEEALRVHGHALGEANMCGATADKDQQTRICRDLESAIFNKKKRLRNQRGGSRPSIAMSRDWSILLTPATAAATQDKDQDRDRDREEHDGRASTATSRRGSFSRRSSTGSMLDAPSAAAAAASRSPSPPSAQAAAADRDGGSRPSTPRRHHARTLRRSITGAIQPFVQLASIATAAASQPPEAVRRLRSPPPLLPPAANAPIAVHGRRRAGSVQPVHPSSPLLTRVPHVLLSHASMDSNKMVRDNDSDDDDDDDDGGGSSGGEAGHSSASVTFKLPKLDSSPRLSLSPDDAVSLRDDSPFVPVTPLSDGDDDDDDISTHTLPAQPNGGGGFAAADNDDYDGASIGTARSWSFVDLDIAVTVNIRSGQCCLYPEALSKDVNSSSNSRSRTGLGGPTFAATSAAAHAGAAAAAAAPSRMRVPGAAKTTVDSTMLLIPGLHVMAAYNTATYNADPSTGAIQLTHMAASPARADVAAAANSEKSSGIGSGGGGSGGGAVSQRRYGTLHVQLIVESLPDEMVIKPSFLVFLENVLARSGGRDAAPTPPRPPQGLTTIAEREEEDESGKRSPAAATASPHDRPPSPTSTLSGQSTTTGSSGLVGGVPIDVLLLVHVKPSLVRLSCMPWSSLECTLKLPSVNVSLANLSPKFAANVPSWANRSGGGGGSGGSGSGGGTALAGQFNSELGGVFLTGTLSRCYVQLAMPYSAPYAGAAASAAMGGGGSNVKRKESLFVELSMIKVALSRQRFPSTLERVGNFNVLVSGVAEVDVAELKYDTRNIGDIASFVKAWSQTRLLEKLLLKPSDEGAGAVLEPERPGMPPQDATSKSSSYDEGEVLLLIGARLAHVLVHTNLSQVMAKTELSLRNVDFQSRVLLASGRMPHGSVALTLGEALLDARDGIVSGHVAVADRLSLHGVRDVDDAFLLQANLGALDLDLEYMHQSVLMLQVCRLVTEINSQRPEEVDSKLLWEEVDVVLSGNTIPSMINISLRLSEFIGQQKRATTRALGSLFPTQSNQRSVMRTQSAPTITVGSRNQSDHFHWYWLLRGDAPVSDAAGTDTGDDDNKPQSQQQQQQHAPPKHITAHVLLQGNKLLVAAFHGSSFREAKWAVFQWCQPLQIDFSATFMEKRTVDDWVSSELSSSGTHCTTQALRVRLGSEMLRVASRHGGGASGLTAAAAATASAAASGRPHERCLLVQHVERRRGHCPSQRDTVADWIRYVKPDDGGGGGGEASLRRPQANVVLSLPAFVLTVDTDQWMDYCAQLQQQQPQKLGMPSRTAVAPPRLAVLCQFDSTFTTPLLVATDVSLYIFLRKLALSYIERAGTMTDQSTRGSTSSATSSSRLASEPGEETGGRTVDPHRTYHTTHWQLQPELQLLSWAPGSLHFQNPPFDWLIEKLGFKHPSDTIPKWTQRTLMDPLDLLMASMSENVFTIRKVCRK